MVEIFQNPLFKISNDGGEGALPIAYCHGIAVCFRFIGHCTDVGSAHYHPAPTLAELGGNLVSTMSIDREGGDAHYIGGRVKVDGAQGFIDNLHLVPVGNK